MRALILDDEKKSRSYLVKLLREYCSEVEVCAEVSGIEEAKAAILQLQPDLLFLDIELRGGNAFDLLNSILSFKGPVIFVTAHEQFALKAFRYQASDYLLKPVDPDDLIVSIRKAAQHIAGKSFVMAPPNQHNTTDEINKIALPSAAGYDRVDTRDIVLVQAESNYCRFFLVNKKEILVSKVLSRYEQVLVEQGFIRVHKSYLINMKHVVRYIRSDGGTVEMTNGKQVTIANRKKAEFLQLLHYI